jgi:hypothetical protein
MESHLPNSRAGKAGTIDKDSQFSQVLSPHATLPSVQVAATAGYWSHALHHNHFAEAIFELLRDSLAPKVVHWTIAMQVQWATSRTTVYKPVLS